MNFSRWMQDHRRSILFLLSVAVLGGLIAIWTLPVSLFPYVDFPRVMVSLDAGDRAAERMMIEVTFPIEQAIRAVPGVRDLRSTTSRGAAEISVNFDWSQDMVAAMLQVQSAINQVLPSLPQGTTFNVRRMDPTVFPVLAYSLTSDTHSLVELRDIAFYQLRPLLSTIRGVAKVEVLGGAQREYQVNVDPARLDAYGLALSDVAKVVTAANVIEAVGRMEDHYKLYLAMSDTRLTNLDQIRNTVLRSGPSGVILLKDVAMVSESTAPQWIRVTADGHDAVIFQVHQQPGGNTVQIAQEIKAKLAEYDRQLPRGIKIANWYDQSELITASATSVRDSIIVGVVFAMLILFVFLRNLKVTLIAAQVVPGVLAATVLLLYVFHMSFNIMTLGGMAAAVGLIIDDAIVMVEHIMRRLREGATDHRGRVMQAAAEFTKSLAGSSASTIIIFAPLAFLSGVTGAFFKALSLTMAASLFISFMVAWLAVPLLADRFLNENDARQESGGRFTERAHRFYETTMRRLLARPLVIVFAAFVLLGLGWLSYANLGSGFMPSMDEGGFILDYRSEPGTSLTETDRLLRRVEAILRATPEVQTYSRRTGLQLGGGLTEANTGDFFVRLKPLPRRDIETVMDEVREKVERQVPGLEIELAQLMEDLIGDLTAVPQPIEIKLYSDDGNLLKKLAPSVAATIQKIPGVVDIKNGIVLAGDALDLHVDRVKASLEGVDPDAVTHMLSDYLTGVVTTQIESGPKMIGVRAWIPHDQRATESDVENLRLRAPDGHLFPLKRVAAATVVTGQPEITRDNLKQMAAVTGRISGRDIGSVIVQVKQALNQKGILPNGVYYSLGGLYAEQQSAFAGLVAVFVGAVALVFLLLLFMYESFRIAIAMLIISLLALAAVLIGLWITRTEINISSMMGMTMIVGIVTEVAIFYLSEYVEVPTEFTGHARLIAAGKNRMRPIAMTTLAAILALMPLALGIGQGAAMQQPLAIAIVSGLAAQLPLVLIVLPALLFLFGVERGDRAASV
jgi:CzcA family heavy metal efflux pump